MRPMSSRVILAVAAVAAMMPMAWVADPTAVADGAVVPSAIADWRPLFDGRTLGDWQPTSFGGGEEPTVVDGAIRIPSGADLNGVTWGGEPPRDSYELTLEARRVDGNDFFCGLTFPVGDECCSLILGGWGGSITGLSSIDGEMVVDQDIENRRISVRNEVSASKPLGIATYATVGEARNIRWRPLPRP